MLFILVLCFVLPASAQWRPGNGRVVLVTPCYQSPVHRVPILSPCEKVKVISYEDELREVTVWKYDKKHRKWIAYDDWKIVRVKRTTWETICY